VNIYALRPDGSGQRNLTGENLADKGEPSFLAMSGWFEGKALIATRGITDELPVSHQVDPATGETELLLTFPTYPGGIYPAPDGTLLVVETSPAGKQTLEFIQPDGKVRETLASFSKGGIYIVAWSHDGQKIAFIVQRDPYTYDDHRVYIINRDGTGLAELYRGLVIPALIFSPDDRYLLVTDQEQALVSISLETMSIQKIPVPETGVDQQILYPSWQP
jgi:Tol biopolymer transport system component